MEIGLDAGRRAPRGGGLMAAPKQFGVADIASFDTVVDVRSPAEFAEDHIPGAINLPVLDNEERATVGTLYVTDSFEARRVGASLVAAHLADHLRGPELASRPANWRPLVNCWRGGMRSGSMVQVMRMVGWDAQPLTGGYKTWRKHVIAQIEERAPRLPLRVLCGATGSAKTRVLQALGRQGAQVLDLEEMARHKGSVLGGLPGEPQPTQKMFETRLVDAMSRLDPEQPVYVEAESRKIGRVAVPTPLLERMRSAECIEIDAPRSARVDFLLRDYDWLTQDVDALVALIEQLKGLQSNTTLERWIAWARGRDFARLVDELLELHYDPQYGRSQRGNFLRLKEARRVPAAALGDADIEAVARAISGRP
jgi:tRNA 2-selenouridine synthase